MTQPPPGSGPPEYEGQPPPGNGSPEYGGQPPPQQPGYGQPQYGGGTPPPGGGPPPYGGGPPSYGGGPGYPGGYNPPPPPKKRSTALIVGILVAALVLAAGGLTAALVIGSDGDSDDDKGNETTGETFCERFRKNAESNEFDNPQPGDEAKLIDELETFKELAPDDLKDDYDVLISAVEGDGIDPSTAVQNIQDYAIAECDITPDATDSE